MILSQVCVEKCPDEFHSFYGDLVTMNKHQVKAAMRPYCVIMDDALWEEKSAQKLIEETLCPAWVLPSSPVIGRCLPTLVELTGGKDEDPEGNSTVIDSKDSPDGKEVKAGTIKMAVYQLGIFLELRGFGERVFNDISNSWWMILLALAAAAILSFLWIVLMRWFAGIMVWTSISLLFILFGGLFGYTLYKYFDIKDSPAAQGNIFTVNITPDYAKV
jgi:choline transporter-like protein 2/4/5